MCVLEKKYFDPDIQRDIWDLVVLHDNEVRTKFARKGKDAQRYVEGQILRPDHGASRSGSLTGNTEDASTPSETIDTMSRKNLHVNTLARIPTHLRVGQGVEASCFLSQALELDQAVFGDLAGLLQLSYAGEVIVEILLEAGKVLREGAFGRGPGGTR